MKMNPIISFGGLFLATWEIWPRLKLSTLVPPVKIRPCHVAMEVVPVNQVSSSVPDPSVSVYRFSIN